jgi:hypothetical protein
MYIVSLSALAGSYIDCKLMYVMSNINIMYMNQPDVQNSCDKTFVHLLVHIHTVG